MDILVPSCAAYSDAWDPFVTLFRKFWPDCPYRLTLITDRLDRPWRGDAVVEIGRDLTWCQNFMFGIRQLRPQFVLLMQEDFWLNAPVETAFVDRALGMMRADPGIGCFRLYPCPGPDIPLGHEYGQISYDARYRVSCQSAIWRADELEFLLAPFPTARHFEIDGTRLSSKQRSKVRYLSVLREDPNRWPLQYYCSAISRGEWDPNALEFCRKVGVPVDTTRRPVMSSP